MKAIYFLTTMCGVAVIFLSACSEIDQQAKTQKVYADKKDEKPYDRNEYSSASANEFSADKTKWEKKLQERSLAQNEYLRTETAK